MVEMNEEGTIARDGKTLENCIFDNATVEFLLATEFVERGCASQDLEDPFHRLSTAAQHVS